MGYYWVHHCCHGRVCVSGHVVLYNSFKSTALLAYWIGDLPQEQQTWFHHGFFSSLSHTNSFGTPVATLPGAWCCRVYSGTGWPGVGFL